MKAERLGKWAAWLKSLPRKKKGLVAAACLAGAAFLMTESAFAWFRAQSSQTNNLSAEYLGYDVQIVDAFARPDPSSPYVEGGKHPKEVSAKNTGNARAFVRIHVAPSILASDGATPLPSQLFQEVWLYLSDGAADRKVAELQKWNEDWLYAGGYFYYRKALEPASETSLLFSKIQIAPAANSKEHQGGGFAYEGSHAKIDCTAEAVAASLDYRKTWWGLDSDTPPLDPALLEIDNLLKGLI
jgi:hypothetical protein